MRTALGVVIAGLWVLSHSTSASATTGGSSMIEVLGLDTRDAKIYYKVIDNSANDEPGVVFFMHLDGKHAGKPQRVLSISKGINAYDDHVEYDRRVAKLKKRLARIKSIAVSKRTGSQVYGDDLPPGLKILTVKRKKIGVKTDPDYGDCIIVRVAVSKPKTNLAARVKMTECSGKSRVTAVFALKGRDELFVLMSSEPYHWEGGYETQVPVQLRAPTAK